MQDIIKSIFLLAFQIIRAFSKLFNISLFEKKENGRDKFLYRDNKILDKKHTFVLDASAMIARSFDNFPVRPERLIERAKEVISVDFGVKDPDVLAEEFEFIFPVMFLPKDCHIWDIPWSKIDIFLSLLFAISKTLDMMA